MRPIIESAVECETGKVCRFRPGCSGFLSLWIVVASAVLELNIGSLEKASDGIRGGSGDSAASLRCPEQSSSRQNETSGYCHIGCFDEDDG